MAWPWRADPSSLDTECMEEEAAAGMGGENGPRELPAAHERQVPCAVTEPGQRTEVESQNPRLK